MYELFKLLSCIAVLHAWETNYIITIWSSLKFKNDFITIPPNGQDAKLDNLELS